MEQFSAALVDSVRLRPLPMLTAARQQRRRGAKMIISNDWQALWVELLDTREISRIVASNIARIELPMWLWSEPYWRMDELINEWTNELTNYNSIVLATPLKSGWPISISATIHPADHISTDDVTSLTRNNNSGAWYQWASTLSTGLSYNRP